MKVVTQRTARGGQDTPAAVALGFFDGVHRGHVAVVEQAAMAARQNGLRLCVFTFVQGPGRTNGLMLTEEQKHARLAALGVEVCYQPPFESFKELSPQRFFEEMLLGEYNAKTLACGQNFAFGAARAGNVDLLRRLCEAGSVALDIAPTVFYESQPVSSSRIRQALAAGKMEDANAMLGGPYEVAAPVSHGKGLGTRLGMPTLNQCLPSCLQLPAHGVYITRTIIDGEEWPSATGFGNRPTVDGGVPSCETFIPGFSGDLYGKRVRVQFFKRIDDVRRFENTEALAAAVHGWAKKATDYFL